MIADPAEAVSIAVFAHVQTALDEAFPLAEVLEREGISTRAWGRAEIEVRQRVAREIEARVEYEESVVAAQDRFDRSVSPVDQELAAWLALLDGFAAAPAPFAYLTRLGLRLSDLARLKRKWTLRAEEDPKFAQKVAELRAKPLPKLGSLVVGASSYVGSGRPRATSVAPAAAAAEPPAEIEIEGLGIDRLAAIGAELGRNPKDRAGVLFRHRLDKATHDAISARYLEAFRRDPSLERDYQRLLAHHDQRLTSAASAASRSRGAEDQARVDAVALARELGQRLAAQGLSLRHTALAPEEPMGRTLPFKPGSPEDPKAATRVPDSNKRKRLSKVGRSTVAADPGVRRPPTLPFSAEARQPTLTLEQHASLCVELSRSPAGADEVLTRYGLDAANKRSLDAAFEKRFTDQPALRVEWERAYHAYEAWLRRG